MAEQNPSTATLFIATTPIPSPSIRPEGSYMLPTLRRSSATRSTSKSAGVAGCQVLSVGYPRNLRAGIKWVKIISSLILRVYIDMILWSLHGHSGLVKCLQHFVVPVFIIFIYVSLESPCFEPSIALIGPLLSPSVGTCSERDLTKTLAQRAYIYCRILARKRFLARARKEGSSAM